MKPFLGRVASGLSMRRKVMCALDERRAREALSFCSFMGFTSRMGGKDLLNDFHRSFAAARSFAESSNFRLAHMRLGVASLKWERAQAPASREGYILLIANCSLGALSLIADAKIKGWCLVVEDCPFSRDFIMPINELCHGNVEFQTSHLLAARMREIKRAECRGITLFVTFCDRPMQTASDCIETNVRGAKHYFSVVDALLMVAAFDEVFVLGSGLRKVVVESRPDWETGRISGEILFQYTSICGLALDDLIAGDPGKYLGVVHLVTRSEKYRVITAGTKRSLIKSLLHYGQINGIPIPEQSYREFLRKLDAPNS